MQYGQLPGPKEHCQNEGGMFLKYFSYQSKLLGLMVENSLNHPVHLNSPPVAQLLLHAQEAHHNASAGNRARVTLMAAMYSTTRPLTMLNACSLCTVRQVTPRIPAVKGLVFGCGPPPSCLGVGRRPPRRHCLQGPGNNC